MAKLFSRRTAAIVAVAAASMLVLSACSNSDSSSDKVAVSLITKDQSNPFFVAMIKGATEKAETLGVELTVTSGVDESDYAGQIAAIENAISAKHAGILIVPVSTEVNAAITKAREAGLYVIALDTAPDPADIVDITFATDNREAGLLIGQWTAAKLAGKKATIALLDIFDDRIVSVDYMRDNGFLAGMGIDVADPNKMGDEPKTGKYSFGEVTGDYEIVGNVATGANEDGGRTGLEQLLAKNKKINVVYTINEPTAIGACAAAAAAGVKIDVMVSVDGGGAGIGAVKSGCINATSQQYPLLMADLGVQAIYDIVKNGTKPTTSEGLDFFNTGVKLITDDPQDGVPSETTEYGLANAWG
jgi:fructose transport system substrate-binding protein